MRQLCLSAFLVGAAGCGGTPCANVADPTGLWSRAALAKVDVYDGKASCDGDRVRGAPAPLESRSFAPGATVDFDTSPGHRTIVLTLYSDAAGTVAFAGACASGNYGANSNTCLSLTLDVFPCGGVGCVCVRSPDSCPLGLHCDDAGTCQPGCADGLRACGGDCIPPSSCCPSDCTAPPGPAACFTGACAVEGGGCTYTPVAGSRVCSTTCCVPTNGACNPDCTLACAAGWANCDGDPSNGCEQNIYDVNSCGACFRVCSYAHAKAACPTGTCVLAGCNAGWVNCDGNTANGCACAGNGCCAGGTCQTAHTNGVGQTFYDCVAQGTLDATQATEACAAFTGSAGQCGSLTCAGTAICSEGSGQACDCWIYSGTAAGHVRTSSPGACNCSSRPNLANWN